MKKIIDGENDAIENEVFDRYLYAIGMNIIESVKQMEEVD